MKVIELASNESVWRGLDYYKENWVKDWKQNGPDTYSGEVQGTDLYSIQLDVSHPRRSTCQSQFVKQTRRIFRRS